MESEVPVYFKATLTGKLCVYRLVCITGYSPGLLQESLSIHCSMCLYTAGTHCGELQYSVIEEHDIV